MNQPFTWVVRNESQIGAFSAGEQRRVAPIPRFSAIDKMMAVNVHAVRPGIVVVDFKVDCGAARHAKQWCVIQAGDTVDCPDLIYSCQLAKAEFSALVNRATQAAHGAALEAQWHSLGTCCV